MLKIDMLTGTADKHSTLTLERNQITFISQLYNKQKKKN